MGVGEFMLSKGRSVQRLLRSKFVASGPDIEHVMICFVPHLLSVPCLVVLIAPRDLKCLHCSLILVMVDLVFN